jgi:hypothetical protein
LGPKAILNGDTVKPVYNGRPWDPQKVAIVQSWPVFTGFSIKIGIKEAWPDLGWLLLTVGCYSELAVNTGLTVLLKTNFVKTCYKLKYKCHQ